jgi:hypothetical protein
MKIDKIDKIFQKLILDNNLFDGTFINISECKDGLDYGFYLETDYKSVMCYGEKTEYLDGNWKIHDRNSMKSRIEDILMNNFANIMFVAQQYRYFPNIDNEYFYKKLEKDFTKCRISKKVEKDFDIEMFLDDDLDFLYLFENLGFKIEFESVIYYLILE